MKPEDVVSRIDKLFFKESEAEKALEDIEGILNDFYKPKELDTTVENVTQFLRRIWERYSLGIYVDVFVDFARAEKALYGFGENYRDHLMHVFNVHLVGLLFFSAILKTEENRIFELLKIKKEPKTVPFPNQYDEKLRLYYLWCLMSTFHDIAIPIDYRTQLVEGFGQYLNYFKIETGEFYLKFPFMTRLDVDRYSDMMSKLFDAKLSLSESNEQKSYEVGQPNTAPYLYLRSILAGAMNRYNHGVLGAYFLFKSIEELFLSGKNLRPKYDLDLCSITRGGEKIELPPEKKAWNEKLAKFDSLSDEELADTQRTYDLTRGETRDYYNYVLKQDVARAALAIALHSVDPDKSPKIFPLKFSDFPLACLLILFDELQEFYRPEGLELTEVVRCRKFPDIDSTVEFLNGKPRIKIRASYDLQRPGKKREEMLVSKYNGCVRKSTFKANGGTIGNYDKLVRLTWDHIFKTIKKKIDFRTEEPLEIYVKVTIEGMDPDGDPLEHRSSNWNHSLDT